MKLLENNEMNQKIPKTITARNLKIWLTEGKPKPCLIDVREQSELDIASFPFAVVHLPLSKSSMWKDTFLKELSDCQSVVVICHLGVRSMNFGSWLLAQEYGYEVWNLEGGIDSWSKEVDLTLKRY